MDALRIFRAYCAHCDREVTDVDRYDPEECESTVACPSCDAALRWRAAETVEA
jgi:hypothetical protein